MAANNGSQATNLYSYGSGGTWSLKNVGPFANPPSNDSTGDEYDMSWTVTQTVSLNTGDKLLIQDNPEWMQGTATGDYYAPVYLSAHFVEPKWVRDRDYLEQHRPDLHAGRHGRSPSTRASR